MDTDGQMLLTEFRLTYRELLLENFAHLNVAHREFIIVLALEAFDRVRARPPNGPTH